MGPRIRLRYEGLAKTRVISIFQNYFYTVSLIPLAASQYTFRIPHTPMPMPSVQYKDHQGHVV